MKRVLFWLSAPFIAVLAIGCSIIQIAFAVVLGAVAVLETLCNRWEFWCRGIEKGAYMNCPWNKTLHQVVKEEASNP